MKMKFCCFSFLSFCFCLFVSLLWLESPPQRFHSAKKVNYRYSNFQHVMGPGGMQNLQLSYFNVKELFNLFLCFSLFFSLLLPRFFSLSKLFPTRVRNKRVNISSPEKRGRFKRMRHITLHYICVSETRDSRSDFPSDRPFSDCKMLELLLLREALLSPFPC